ncbi:MAG TPA: HAD-IC family P-type ATPase, partial [Burkholderiaceae bacterium]|nr:HAD-IC family P-type ATPase [Burkholderiaceae bacterium]
LEARCDTAGPYAGRWRLGSAAWCSAGAEGVQTPAVWLAREVDAGWQAVLRAEFDELLRADAIQSVAQLLRSGIEVHLLSGDHRASVAAMALRLGLAPQRARALCTPPDKLTVVEGLQASDRVVAMVGDGINDAPVLARADVSVAMGSAAALAQARADVIVLSNRVGDLVALREVAIETMRIVRQNLAWALIYNLAGVPLALVGWLPPWLAGIGMALSSLLVVLNALRLTRWGRWRADATAVVPLPRVA